MSTKFRPNQVNWMFFCLLTLASLYSPAQNCPPGPLEIGQSGLLPPCEDCGQYAWGELHRFSYTDSLQGNNYGNVIGPDKTHYHDQWLDLYLPVDQSQASPVYIFAHSGSQTADDAFPNASAMAGEGIAFISWESAQTSQAAGGSYYENTPGLFMSIADYWENTHRDFQLVLDWVWEHAEQMNLDTNRVFVGGGSRGTRISFKELDQEAHPIQGVFMTQAFADGDWFSLDMVSAQGCPAEPITDYISSSYPPLVIHYKSTLGDVNNAHDPLNGLLITEKYTCLGIESRIIHSLGDAYQWNDAAMEFILDPEAYLQNHPQEIVDAGVVDPNANVIAPPSLSIDWEPFGANEFRLRWPANQWDQNMLAQPYPNKEPDSIHIELRLFPLGDSPNFNPTAYCQSSNWQSTQAFETGHTGDIHIPQSNWFEACSLGFEGLNKLEEGQWYAAQVRCNLSPSTAFFQARSHKFWTDWSSPIVFEGPCPDSINDLGDWDFNDALILYPNPGEGILGLNLRPNQGHQDLQAIVYDINGRVLINEVLHEHSFITIEELPSGAYILFIKGEEYYQKKLFIKR